jgi:hypothetical protein
MTMQVYQLATSPRLVRFEGTYRIIKVESRRLIGGYASVEVRDSQGETITLSALKDALGPFMEAKAYRNVHVLHSNIEVGKVIDSVVDSEGHLWTTHVDDVGLFVVCEIDRPIREADRVWEAIEEGARDPNSSVGLTMFSIAGEAIERSGPGEKIIDKLELHEITICMRGSNPGAKFVIIKAIPASDPSLPAELGSLVQGSGAVFTRESDGTRFLVLPSNQARKGEIGPSEVVSVLEQRTPETKEKGEIRKLGNEPDKTGNDPATNETTEKIDMPAILELSALLTKVGRNLYFIFL